MKKEKNKNPIQPVAGTKVPRFAGANTFARLPELRDVESCNIKNTRKNTTYFSNRKTIN